MVQGVFVQRVLHLGSISIGNIDAIVVLLAQQVVVNLGFDPAEGVPKGELVQGIAFKILHPIAAEKCLHRQFRELVQLPALRFGDFVTGHHPGSNTEAQPQQDHGK